MAPAARVLFSGQHLYAEVHNPDADVLFVTLDHWRVDRQPDFPVWAPSEIIAARGFAELIIKTARNDWFLNTDLDALTRELDAFTGRFRTVRSFTFSMGGFAALLLSKSLRLRTVVMMSPQWSVFPDQAPHDKRYRKEASVLDPDLSDLVPRLADGLRGVVVFDPTGNPLDREHARMIAAHVPTIRPVAMPFGGHPASRHLFEAKVYWKLRRLALMGQSDPSQYRAIHREAREKSEIYLNGLQTYLTKRSARVS